MAKKKLNTIRLLSYFIIIGVLEYHLKLTSYFYILISITTHN